MFSGLVDGQLLALSLCQQCLGVAEPLTPRGAVDVLVLEDQLAGGSRLPGGGLQPIKGEVARSNRQQ